MATIIRKNERSWAIELISQINQFSKDNDLIIKHAGGESTVSEHRGQNMFQTLCYMAIMTSLAFYKAGS